MPRCPECSEELRGDEVVCPNCLARLSPADLLGPSEPAAASPAPVSTERTELPSPAPVPAAVLSPLPTGSEPAAAGQPARPGYSRGTTHIAAQQPAGAAAARPSAQRLVRAVTLFTAGAALLLIGVLIGQVAALSRPAQPTVSPFDEGTALYQQGRYQAAEYAFGRAADAGIQRSDATAAPALAMMGWSAYRAGDYAGAGDLFAAAAGMDADRADTYAGLGLASLGSGDLGGAQAAFDEALGLDANLAEAHRGLGRLYLKLERPELAMLELERAVELNPDDAEAHGALGVAFEEAGRYTEAIQELEAAIRGAPASPWVGDLLESYWAVGQYEDATRAARNRLDAEPQDPRWEYAYGLALWRANELEPARAAFEKVLTLNPRLNLAGDANRMWGVTLAQQEKYEEALALLTRAIALQPQDAAALAERGWALARVGRCAEGLADFVSAKAIDPTMGAALEGERACRQWLGQP